jgi:hypothetical protein
MFEVSLELLASIHGGIEGEVWSLPRRPAKHEEFKNSIELRSFAITSRKPG